MAHQLLVAKLDGALSATSAAEANFATLPRRLCTLSLPLSHGGVHHLEPALSWLGHHGGAKAPGLCSFLQDGGRARGDLPWGARRSSQRTALALCEVQTRYSKQATAFMFPQGQQQPMMGQYPQQPMSQPQQPMMGQQQPTMGQQQPIMGQQPLGQPNYQQPAGQNYGGPGSQGNNGFSNSGGGYNNGNNGGGASNSSNGGGNSNSNNGNSNSNSSSGGSPSKNGKGGAIAAGILLPVIFAALGGVVAYVVFCRGGNTVPDPDPGSDPYTPSRSSEEEDDDDDDTGSSP